MSGTEDRSLSDARRPTDDDGSLTSWIGVAARSLALRSLAPVAAADDAASEAAARNEGAEGREEGRF